MFQVLYASGGGFASDFAALVEVVMRHTFNGTSLFLLCSGLRFRVWFH